MLTDALLAIAHHLLIFALLGLLVVEMMTLRPGMTAATVIRIARLDTAYGATATLIVVIGIGRVLFGLKGPEFFVSNWFFWAKMAAFVTVGLLSVPPTLQIFRWRAALRANASFAPPESEILRARRFMHYEGIVFFLIPVFAALMVRYD